MPPNIQRLINPFRKYRNPDPGLFVSFTFTISTENTNYHFDMYSEYTINIGGTNETVRASILPLS